MSAEDLSSKRGTEASSASPREERRSRSRSPRSTVRTLFAESPETHAGDAVVRRAREGLAALCVQAGVPGHHGLEHACSVLDHAERALDAAETSVPSHSALAVRLAALLHDADDRKYFPSTAEEFPNAKRIMAEAGADDEVVSAALRMIGLVSCSKNGNHVPPELAETPFWLWPRWADRLEATGEIGVVRCWQYNREKGDPLSCATTPRPGSEDEVWALATEERFAEYQRSGGKSFSMIDHYYDKLLRVACPSYSTVRNKYLEAEMDRRAAPLVAMCLEYGRTGRVREDLIREMAARVLPSALKDDSV